MTGSILTLTNSNFDQHFTESKLLVIDFWAPWCEPCKDFGRMFQEVAEEKKAEAVFGKINIDEEKTLAQDFSIRSVPTLAIIRNKVMVFYQSGLIPKKAFIDLINQAITLPDVDFPAEK